MNLWISILEANLNTLLSLEGEVLALETSNEKSRQVFYIEVLKNFYRQDADGIAQLIRSQTAWLQDHSDLHALSSMRELIRRGDYNPSEIHALVATAPTSDLLFRGEISFVAASALQMKSQYLEAEGLYRQAAALYKKSGAIRKSLRALLSSIAAYSCHKPESRLFAEYMNLYEEAIAASEFLTAATALINISREFHILGGLEPALENVNRALDLLKVHALGSREHGLGLVHRAHVLIDLKHFALTQQDLIYALSIPHAEVQAACAALAQKHNLNLKNLKSSQLLPTWKERLAESKPLRPLTRLESTLISLIATQPLTKYELMDMIYGDRLDFESKEARFKNLLARVRSSRPGLVVLENQKYIIHEPSAHSLLKVK